MKYKLLLLDDHQVVLESLANLLMTVNDFEVVGTANTAVSLLSMLDYTLADVLITDLALPDMRGLQLISEVKSTYPRIGMLVCSASDSQQVVGETLRAGASGYVTKTADKTELCDAIMAVATGKRYVDSRVFTSYDPRTTPVPDALLTTREREVVGLILDELSSNEIAERLFISFNTVETHRKRIYQKIGVSTSLGLMKYAIRHGLSHVPAA